MGQWDNNKRAAARPIIRNPSFGLLSSVGPQNNAILGPFCKGARDIFAVAEPVYARERNERAWNILLFFSYLPTTFIYQCFVGV